MGCSVAAPLKSFKAQQGMLSFLREHLRPVYWNNPKDTLDWSKAMTDDLSYDQSKLKIGFDYSNSQNFYGRYRLAVIRWMALRVGRKVRLEGYSEAVPYYRFDGYAPVPVLLRSVWDGRKLGKYHDDGFVDEDGFKPSPKPWAPVSFRMDGLVERTVTTNASRAVLDNLQKNNLFTVTGEEPQLKVEAYEPAMITHVEHVLKTEGYSCEVEFGPVLLSPERQRVDDKEAPKLEAEDAIIKLELARLSKLWAATQGNCQQ